MSLREECSQSVNFIKKEIDELPLVALLSGAIDIVATIAKSGTVR